MMPTFKQYKLVFAVSLLGFIFAFLINGPSDPFTPVYITIASINIFLAPIAIWWVVNRYITKLE